MNVMDMGLDDDLIATAYDEDLISDWERNFLLGLINFANLSEKQETKARLILRKIERGIKSQTKTCSHCGSKLS